LCHARSPRDILEPRRRKSSRRKFIESRRQDRFPACGALLRAAKFTKEGEVTLRVRKVADGRDWVELAVWHTGIGLTADSRRNCSRNSRSRKRCRESRRATVQ
jgi:hypothetical protein